MTLRLVGGRMEGAQPAGPKDILLWPALLGEAPPFCGAKPVAVCLLPKKSVKFLVSPVALGCVSTGPSDYWANSWNAGQLCHLED